MFVYIVKRNCDMTEGRGPMHISRVFQDIAHAIKFAESQTGIMGSRFSKWNFRESYETQSKYNYWNETVPDRWSSNHGWEIEAWECI